jgi:cytochrome P450
MIVGHFSHAVRRHLAMMKLRARVLLGAASAFCRLPPGRLGPRDWTVDADQLFFVKKAETLGPIFKLMCRGNYTTCIVGHQRARELLLAHEDRLPGGTIELRGLFSKGALRAMSGVDHQKYKQLFIRALQATPIASHEAEIRKSIVEKLGALAKSRSYGFVSGPELRSCLREITSGIMLRLLFGLNEDDGDFAELLRFYRQFGPEAPVYSIGPDQTAAYAEIECRVRRLADDIRRNPSEHLPSFLSLMVECGELDETAIGNLIYMFEPAHFDMYSLWRWVLKHLASNTHIMDRVQKALNHQECGQLCEAIVLETLRLEQSELLYRAVRSDITYESYFIPKGTILRVCLWEGHKDPSVFPDPFRFDPDRFIGRSYRIDEYAPFGLDKRRCIAANLVVALTSIFIEILLKRFVFTVTRDGPPKYGAYHWEPNPEFSISIACAIK